MSITQQQVGNAAEAVVLSVRVCILRTDEHFSIEVGIDPTLAAEWSSIEDADAAYAACKDYLTSAVAMYCPSDFVITAFEPV